MENLISGIFLHIFDIFNEIFVYMRVYIWVTFEYIFRHLLNYIFFKFKNSKIFSNKDIAQELKCCNNNENLRKSYNDYCCGKIGSFMWLFIDRKNGYVTSLVIHN